ncbi:MAG: hypothetical protein QXX09_04350 [Candidatus Methanomethylicia archaeon]
MMTLCCKLSLKLPIFTSRYIEAAEVYISSLLPSPRTVLSLLAKGIGELNELSPEEEEDGIRVADILMWAVERSSYAFVKPTSSLCRSSRLWRIKHITEPWVVARGLDSIPDAVVEEVVSLSSLDIYYLLNLDKLNESLKNSLGKYKKAMISLNEKDIKKALLTNKRVGNTECLSSQLEEPTLLRIEETDEPYSDVYVPLDWIEGFKEGTVEDLYISVSLFNKDLTLNEFKKGLKDIRTKKLKFLLPLRVKSGKATERPGRLVWHEFCRLEIRKKEGYEVYKAEDGTFMLIPSGGI